MKKVITIAALVMAALSITATTALASPGPVEHRQAGLQGVGTGCGQCQLHVYVSRQWPRRQHWANDTIKRQIQIFKVAGGYCATVKDQGSFVTLAGTSPGDTGNVSAGITGTIKGGYTTTLLTGTLNPSDADPRQPRKLRPHSTGRAT